MGNELKNVVYNFNLTWFKILIFGLILLFGANANIVHAQLPTEEIVDLEFEYPDQIEAGQSFIFKVILKKADNYVAPGSIRCIFTGGMLPGSSQITDTDFSVDNKTAIIQWNEISKSNLIFFPVSVNTEKNQGGVYPVRVSYEDKNGLQLSKNIGIFIAGKEKPSRLPQPNIESPFTVNLVYPEEVYFDEEYDLDIKIAKGKNTGGAKVFLQIPPQSELTVLDYPDFRYKQQPGDLSISLNSMPASPEFSIRCKVKNTSKIKSVYPIRATVKFLNGTELTFNDFILVTDTKTPTSNRNKKNSMESVNAATNTDTASLFQELDRLLGAWTNSTRKINTSSTEQTIETPAEPDKKEDISPILKEEVIFYSIQIAASAVTLTQIESQLEEKGIQEKILEDYDGSIYRYSVGDFETIEKAQAMRKILITKGYPDAFIVEYVDGNRKRSIY